MTKKGKNRGVYKPNLYLSIISEVRKNNRLPKLNISKQARNYYISRLKKEGVIVRKGYGVWEYKGEAKKVKKGVQGCRSVRGHSYQFRVAIVKRIDNIESLLSKRGIGYVKYKWGGLCLDYDGQRVIVCKDCILVYYKEDESFYNDSGARGCRLSAVEMLRNILKKVESDLLITLRQGNRYKFTIFNQHYARVSDTLAEDMNRKDDKLKCYYNGRCWLLIDKSLNGDELETVHPSESEQDHDEVIAPFFNDLKDYYTKTGEPILPSQLMLMLSQMVSIQQNGIQGFGIQQAATDIEKNRKLPEYIG